MNDRQYSEWLEQLSAAMQAALDRAVFDQGQIARDQYRDFKPRLYKLDKRV